MRLFIVGLCFLSLLAQIPHTTAAQGQFCAVLRLRNAPQFEDLEKLETMTGGDFNGDGRPDLALALNDSLTRTYAVLIRLNNGGGGFNPATQFTVQESPLALAAGDFDGDGRLDLVIAHRVGSEFLRFYSGQGNGAFTAGAQLAITQPADIAGIMAVDLNGDRRPELIVQSDFYFEGANPPGFTPFVNVLRNNGSGSFSAPTRIDGKSALVEDFNGDGKPDLAVTRSDALQVLAGRGDGTFGAALNQSVALREVQHSMTAGDFNGDGKMDLAATTNPTNNALGGQVVILPGNGAGDFTDRLTFTDVRGSLRLVRALKVASRTDLVVADGTSATYLQNNGGAQFSRTTTVLARGLRDLVVSDFNDDGRADFALLDKTVTLFINNGGGGFTDAPLIAEHQSQFLKTALGDLNNDGNEDLAALEAPNKLTILRGDSAGRFARAQQFELGENPSDVLIADFNRDGRRDVAALSRNNGLSIRLTTSAGELGAATNYAVGTEPYNFAALDYDADGKLDLAVTNANNANLTLLRGNGSGGFESPRSVARATGNFEIISGDFNGDGRGDLLVTNGSERAIALQSNGDGTFVERGSYAVGAAPRKVVLGDFNADGRADIAVGSTDAASAASDIVVLFSQGDGTFTPAPRVEWGHNHAPLTVADINSDGKLDLVMSNARESLLLLQGDGAGRFPFTFDRDGLAFPRSYFALGAPLNDLVSKDLNRDGFPDFVLAGQGITVLYGACLRTATPLAAVSAANYIAPLAPDSIGAIFGTRLATGIGQAATNPLPTTLGGTTGTLFDSANQLHSLPLFFVSPGQVNFQVPTRAALGNAEVRVNSGDGAYAVGNVNLVNFAPGIFTANADGLGVPAALALRVRSDGSQVYESILQRDSSNRYVPSPIDLGTSAESVFLVLFGTGLRYRGTAPVQASIGGTNAEVTFAGAQGSLVGVDQINLRLPRTLIGRGLVNVVLTVGNLAANTVQIQIR